MIFRKFLEKKAFIGIFRKNRKRVGKEAGG